jgi:hypothetical protein
MSKNMAVLNDNNEVINIIVSSDDEPETQKLISYSEENPAYIGGDYFEGYFYPPKPFPSWTRDSLGSWESPIPYPNDNIMYSWNEDQGDWIPFIFS